MFAAIRGDDDVFMFATGKGLNSGVAAFSGTSVAPTATGTRVEQQQRYTVKPTSSVVGWLGSATACVFLGGMDVSFMVGGSSLLTGTTAYKQPLWVGLRKSTSHVALGSGLPSAQAFDGFGFGVDRCIPDDRPDAYSVSDNTTWNTVTAAYWSGCDLVVTARSGTINTIHALVAYEDGTCSTEGFAGRTGTGATTYSFTSANGYGSPTAAIYTYYIPSTTAYTAGNNWAFSSENANLGWAHCASQFQYMGTSNRVDWTQGPVMGGNFLPSQEGYWYATESSGPATAPTVTTTTMRYQLGRPYQVSFHQAVGGSTVTGRLTDVTTGSTVTQTFTARTDALNPMMSSWAASSTSAYPYLLNQLSARAMLKYSA